LADWANEAWGDSKGRVYRWCRAEQPQPILATQDAQGEWLMSPHSMVEEAADRWADIWKEPADVPWDRVREMASSGGMPEISVETFGRPSAGCLSARLRGSMPGTLPS
jgi:hypothetical protein